MNINPQKRMKTVDIADLAFYNGANGIPLTETQHQIHAIHQKEQAKLKAESTKKQKPLEAVVERMEQTRSRVEQAWTDIQNKVGVHSPIVSTAWIVASLALAALLVDCLLLAPSLDVVGISNPILQYAMAFGLAALFGAGFHLVHETFLDPAMDAAMQVVWWLVGAFEVVVLLVWGVLRGFQMKFSADLHRNPLGDFLGGHPVLSSIFFCFISLAAPLIGAAALAYAEPRIHAWLTWHRSKRAHENLHNTLQGAQKKLEAERADLRHKLEQFEAERTIWQAIAAQYHERGRQRGARQVPKWTVLVKAALWGLGGLAAGALAGPFLAPLYVLLPAGAGTGAFMYYHRRRFHPGYARFRKQENTHFAVSTERPLIELPPEPMLLSAPKEERR
jgi:hypothetical protein